MLRRPSPSRLPVLLALAAMALAAGCGGSSAGATGGPPEDGPSSPDVSGVDLADYTASGNVGASGVRVQLADGLAVSVAGGFVPADAGIGVRVATASHRAEDGATVVSPWYDVGVTVTDLSTQPSAPITLEIPAQPPAEAVGHPGLRLWLVPADEDPIPVRGTYLPATGVFQAVLLALPPRATFAVEFNPAIVRLDGADVPDETDPPVLWAQAPSVGWTTTEWTLDYDGNVVTAAQAANVMAAARTASRAYSPAGFREPVLVRDAGDGGPRWHVHLIGQGGSHFEGDTQTVNSVQQRIGSLYVDVACLANPVGPKANSMQAQVAHELFHAVFYAYLVPRARFTYQEDGHTYAYWSTSGYNEGMATTLGTFIEQGRVIPRPGKDPKPFDSPLGYFHEDKRWQAYQNQDFFVFLLRVGSLANFRRMVEALEASQPVTGLTRLEILARYGQALDAADLGLTGGSGTVGMTEFLAEYVANRGYVRTPEGQIWPEEPSGGTPGASYVLDRTLFDRVAYEVDETDCESEGATATCEFTLPMDPMTGYLVDADLNHLGSRWGFLPNTVQASAATTAGKVAFWMFGEKDGQGSAGLFARSADGTGAVLAGLGDAAPDLRMILAEGGGDAEVTVTMVFTGSTDLGPECSILADCCPNLPSSGVIAQCQEIVAKADEDNCRIGQASLLRLCR